MSKLVAVALEENQRQRDVLEELSKLLAGGPGIGDVLRDLYNYWNDLWPHEGDYVFNFAKDAPNMKRLVKMLTVEELKQRMLIYLKCRDEFYHAKKHPFPMFVATVNNWAGNRAGDDSFNVPVVGCLHSPPCRSDQDHTRKRQQEIAQ